MLAGIHRNLAPDGVVMLVESNMSGSLDDDVADPFAVVSYACGVLYCLQEGRVSLEGRSGNLSRDAISRAYFGI